MIQLTELEEHGNVEKDEITFTLVFVLDKLPDHLWPLIETGLRDYKYYGPTNVVAETQKEDGCIKLHVTYQTMGISNVEMEDNLELLKEDFIEYYQRLIQEIRLIPGLKTV